MSMSVGHLGRCDVSETTAEVRHNVVLKFLFCRAPVARHVRLVRPERLVIPVRGAGPTRDAVPWQRVGRESEQSREIHHDIVISLNNVRGLAT